MKLHRQSKKRSRRPKSVASRRKKKPQRKTTGYTPQSKAKSQSGPENRVQNISIFESEIKIIAEQAEIWGELETGGELYGYFLHNGTLVIMFATPPGKNAIHRANIFQQDYHFFLRASSMLFNRFSLNFIGNWHSHHFMEIKTLSRMDIANLKRIAQKNNFSRLCQLLITFEYCPETDNSGQYSKYETNIKSYYYPDAATGLPRKCSVKVIPGVSPIRQAIELEHELKSFLTVPKKKTNNRISLDEYKFDSGGNYILPQCLYAQVDQFIRKNNLAIQHLLKDSFIIFQIHLSTGSGLLFIVYDIRKPQCISSIFYKIDEPSDRLVNISDKILVNNQAKVCLNYAFKLCKKLIVKQISQLSSCGTTDQKLTPNLFGQVIQTVGGIQ